LLMRARLGAGTGGTRSQKCATRVMEPAMTPMARMTVMMFKMATVMVATSIKAIAVNHRAARLLSSLVTPNRE